jgi:two-component system chemotaxis response regulator CheY
MSKKYKVVITDDEPHVRVFLKFAMNNMGLTVIGEAENGDQAVEVYRKLQPDMLLLDLNMPVKTGEAALREIRSEFPSACVVMLSSSADRESVEECAQLGAAHYIRKDCPFDEMKEIILSILTQDKKDESWA